MKRFFLSFASGRRYLQEEDEGRKRGEIGRDMTLGGTV
jgi:hypothetical protein